MVVTILGVPSTIDQGIGGCGITVYPPDDPWLSQSSGGAVRQYSVSDVLAPMASFFTPASLELRTVAVPGRQHPHRPFGSDRVVSNAIPSNVGTRRCRLLLPLAAYYPSRDDHFDPCRE